MKPTQAILATTGTMRKKSVPEFGVGDTVRVSVKVVEGSRERTQVFEGVVMRRRKGGIDENFTVRRIASHGIGVERTFLLHSPRVEKIEVIRRGVVRRAQLYYLRGLTGKAARIKERRYRPGDKSAQAAAALDSSTAELEAETPGTDGTAEEPELENEEIEAEEPEVEEEADTDADDEDDAAASEDKDEES